MEWEKKENEFHCGDMSIWCIPGEGWMLCTSMTDCKPSVPGHHHGPFKTRQIAEVFAEMLREEA